MTWYATRSGRSWPDQVAVLGSTIPLYLLILAVVMAAAWIAWAGAGRLARWVPLDPRRAATAAMVAGAGCLAGDAVLLAGLAVTSAAGAPLTWPALLAATASAVRFTVAAFAVRRCAALRTAAR